jgi:hypothetical protein
MLNPFLLALCISFGIALMIVWIFPQPQHSFLFSSEDLYDKLIIALCTLTAIAIVIVIQATRLFKSRREEKSEEQKWNSLRNSQSASAASSLKPIVDEQRASYEVKQRDNDRKYFGEGATFLLLFVAAGIALMQWTTLEKTDKTLNSTLVSSNRAWLGVNRIEFWRGIDDQKGMAIVAYYQNIGRSPALDVKTGGTWMVVPLAQKMVSENEMPITPVWSELDRQIKQRCRGVQPLDGGSAVFPFNNVENFEQLAAPDPMPDMHPVKEKTSIIVAPGCLTYRTFDSIQHTGFCQYAIDVSTPPSRQFRWCPAGNFAE